MLKGGVALESFLRIPSVFMRGGTSKGLILKSNDLPADPIIRDRLITRIYGSPDVRQIDGIGGGTPLTSKLAIVGAASRRDADISYTFGQVSLEENKIDYRPTCGNMAAAVGLFAAEEGYVELTDSITIVRIFNTNTNNIIEAEIPVKNGKIQYDGTFSIDGVPGTSSCIMINYLETGGAITGNLLPTGNTKDSVKLDDGRKFDITVIDAANVIVFVHANQLNIKGTEIGKNFNRKELLNTLEAIRVEAGIRVGLIKDKTAVTPYSHALPKIAVVSHPQSYNTNTGDVINLNKIDIVGRYISMGTLHEAFAVSGGIGVAVAAQIPGTIIAELFNKLDKQMVNIGHPSGTMRVEAKVEKKSLQYNVRRAAIGRTARRLMEGYSIIPTSFYISNVLQKQHMSGLRSESEFDEAHGGS